MIKFLKGPSFYISLWIVYNLQGILYNSGNALSQLLLFVIIALSLIHFVKSFAHLNQSPIYLGLTLLVLLFTFYGVPYLVSGEVLVIDGMRYPAYSFLKNIFASLLPIYSFYHFTKEGSLNAQVLSRWVLVFVMIAIVQYFRLQNETLAYYYSIGSSKEELVNNQGYLFVSLIPAMTLFKRRPIFQYIGLAICLLFVLMSMKRGSILIAAILFLMIIVNNIRSHSTRLRISTILLSLGVIIAGVFIINTYMLQSDLFQLRVQATLSGDTSNRDLIYKRGWDFFTEETNLFHFVFGYGAYGIARQLGGFAHNDWIEIIIGQGLVGITVYLLFFVSFLKTIKISKKRSVDINLMLKLVFMLWFLRSIFSAGYADMSIYVTSVLGFAIANMESECSPSKIKMDYLFTK